MPDKLAAQDYVFFVEIDSTSNWEKPGPPLAALKKSTNWEKVDARVLLSSNASFALRIPMDSVLRGDHERILSVCSEATLFMYENDGSTVAIRDLLQNAPRVNDKISIKLSQADNVEGYFTAFVQPRIGWVPSAEPNTRSGLILLSSKVDDYDIIASHFDLKAMRPLESIMLILLGGTLILGCYFGLLFFSNRDEYIFGIYSAYLFFHSVYWFERISSLSIPLFSRSVDQMVVNTVSQICFHVAFALLAYELLNFKRHYPSLAKIWKIFALLQLVFAAVFSILIYSGVDSVILSNAFAIERCIIAAIAIGTTFYFVARPHNIYCYFLGFASFAFVGSALTAMFLENIMFFAFGLSIEILTFAYAIGHKIRKSDEARIESEKSAFRLEREVIRTKDAALRAQMNPHFISNVINALRALILEGENQQAYNYLSRFAHVVRTMLGSADKQLIPLNEEIRLLKDYIALEELRFGRAVKFNFQIDDSLDIDGALIPPMLLQPLVENSMHHGLFPLTARDPQISIIIKGSPASNLLNIVVSDNGIGRKKAAETQQKRRRQRPSMAMNIIRERIKLLQEGSSDEFRISIEDALVIKDLVDENGQGKGTEITLIVPSTILENQWPILHAKKKEQNDEFDFLLTAKKKQPAADLPPSVLKSDQKLYP